MEGERILNRHFVAAAAAGAALLAGSAAGHPVRGSSPPVPGPQARGAPVLVVARFHAALAGGDAAAAAALLDPAATIFEEGYVERSKADYVASHLPADIAFTRAIHETLERRDVTAGSDMAVVTSESRLTGVFKDKAVDRVSVETMALRRGPGGWRIVHIHWSSHAAK